MVKGKKIKELIFYVVLISSLVFLYNYFLKKNLFEGQHRPAYGEYFSLSQTKVSDLEYKKPIEKVTTCDEILNNVSPKDAKELKKMWNYYPGSIYHNHQDRCGLSSFDSDISTIQIPFCSHFGYGSHNPAYVCTRSKNFGEIMSHHDAKTWITSGR